MIRNKVIALSAAVGVAVAGVALAAPANAEPVTNSYVVVGSDTLQDVLNALANGTTVTGSTVRSATAGGFIGSFDAYGSTLIQTKPAGPRIGRPNGSTDGVKALSRSIDGQPYTATTPGSPTVAITGQVDVARSSSGPGSSANQAGPLLYVPFGRDALTYAHTGDAAVLGNLDQATLTGIFNCTIRDVGGVTVIPVIPQSGSGTRSDWLSKLGLTAAYSTANPSCVVTGQEHDSAKLFDGSTMPANAIVPMSAAQWVAQSTGAGIDRRGPLAVLGSPVSGVSAVTGTGASTVPNATFYSNVTWGRDTYVVVEYARVEVGNAKYDANLAALVDSTKATSLTNRSTVLSSQAGSVKRKFGFLAPLSTTPIRSNFK